MLHLTNSTELFKSKADVSTIVEGRELAHQSRLVGPRQRACIAVNLHNNKTAVLPTLAQYRRLLNANAPYVAIARAMPAEQRTQLLYGKVDISFSAILRERRSRRLASLGNDELAELIDDIGIDRVRALVCVRDTFAIAAG